MTAQLPSKSCAECSRLRQALQEVVESTQSRAPAHHIARAALSQKPLSVQTFRPAERHGMDWKCACGELDSRHICPGLPSETDEQRWRHEAEGTLDKLYAFLQAKNVPHAVDTRDWIDNALRVLDAYEPAPKACAAPQRCPWTDNGSPCIYVEGHTAPHVSEVRAKAVAHPATSQNGSEQR